MEEGLWNHAVHSGQQGRWQVLSQPEQPRVVLDGGHNVDGVKLVVGKLNSMRQGQGGQLHVVWGVVADKDLSAVLSLLPSDAVFHWCQADIPRALPAEELQETAAQFGLPGKCFDRVEDAYRHALQWPSPRTSFGWEGACSWWATCCVIWTKKPPQRGGLMEGWAVRDSNPRPPRCKRGALNQLS